MMPTSTPGEVLYHRQTGEPAQTWEGFNWTAFMFPGLWMVARGSVVAGIGLIAFHLIGGILFVLLPLAMRDDDSFPLLFFFGVSLLARWAAGAAANSMHRDRLQSRGFVRKPRSGAGPHAGEHRKRDPG